MKSSIPVYKWLVLLPALLLIPFLLYQAVNPALHKTNELFVIGMELLPRLLVFLLGKLCVVTVNEYLFFIGILLYISAVDLVIVYRDKFSASTSVIVLGVCATLTLGEVLFRMISHSYINQIASQTYRLLAIGHHSLCLLLLAVEIVISIKALKKEKRNSTGDSLREPG